MRSADSIVLILGSKTAVKLLLGSIVLLVGLGAGMLFWITYSSSVDEQRIREVLETRARALSQKDLSLYLSCFSPNYHSGIRTYEDLKADASQWFLQFVTIQFSFQTVDLQVHDDEAIVENTYKFSLINADGESLQIAKRELLEMRRENKEWRITKSLSIQ